MKRFLSVVLAITLCLSTLLTLGLSVFADEGATVTGPEWSVEDRNYSRANGFGLYFRPVVGEDGKVTPKAYRTICTKYTTDKLYGVTEGDIDINSWLNPTFGADENGFLKISSTTTGVNSMGAYLRWGGVIPASYAKYVVVSYRVVGKTLTQDDNKKLLVGRWNGWADNRVDFNVTNTDDGWNIAVMESNLTLNNWFTNEDLCLQFPDLNDENAYFVLDFIGFCETEADAQAMAAEHDRFVKALEHFVPVPSVSTASGTFYEAQTVSITAKDGVEIHYTTDGTEPTKDSPKYTAALTVEESMTLKVIGVQGEYTSNVIVRDYVIKSNTCQDPVIKLPGEYFPAGTKCEITTTDEGVTIYYTTDGSDPSETNGTEYAAPFVVEGACTVKAIAVKAGATSSSIVSKSVTKIGKDYYYWVFSGIKANPNGPAYVGDNWELLDGYNLGNDTDGALKMPFKINSETGVGHNNILSWFDDYNKYDKRPNSAYPYVKICYKSTINVDFQIMFDWFNNLGIDKDEEGNTVGNVHPLHTTHYSLTKTDDYTTVVMNMADLCRIWDKFAGGVCSTGIIVDANNATETDYFNLKYIAFFASEEAANAFDMVSVPAFSVPEGFYTEKTSVELSTATDGADIYYTTDGSEPSATNGTKYTGALLLTQNTTIKAIAVKDGLVSSAVVTATYEISLKAKQPVVNVPGGKYTEAQEIVITTATEGAQIYYTTDGSTPSATNGTLYNGPFTLSKTCILRVIAVADGMNDSTVTAVNYKFDIQNTTTEGNDTTANTAETGTTSTEEPKAQSGCGSVIGASMLIPAVISMAVVFGLKKKKED